MLSLTTIIMYGCEKLGTDKDLQCLDLHTKYLKNISQAQGDFEKQRLLTIQYQDDVEDIGCD